MGGKATQSLPLPLNQRASAFFLLTLLSTIGNAQQPWRLGGRIHFGFLWPHNPSITILVEGHAPATELFVERRVNGDRPWHKAYGLPRYGLFAIHTRMANPEHIGDAVGLVPYLTLPFTHGDRLTFGLRIGWGIGWIAKPYDRRENTQQIAVGSSLNTVVQLMPELRYQRQRLAITTGLAIDHWSNGCVKQPNLGLNFLSLSLGASYALAPLPSTPASLAFDSTAYERSRREFSVVGALGMNESGRPLNGQYSVYSLSGDASWRVGLKGSLGTGVDVFNKGNLSTVHDGLEGDPRSAFTQLGLHGSGALLMGRGELLMHFGAYVHTPVPEERPVYQRFGVRYRIGRHLLASICLKTHFTTADHWEFGLGYRWN